MNILKLNGLYVHYKLDTIEMFPICFFLILHLFLQYNSIDDVTIYMYPCFKSQFEYFNKETCTFCIYVMPLSLSHTLHSKKILEQFAQYSLSHTHTRTHTDTHIQRERESTVQIALMPYLNEVHLFFYQYLKYKVKY